MKQLIHVIAFSSALLIAGPTSATTVTYIMDRSNVLQNEEDYLSVSLSDDVAGQLDFIVYALSPLEEIAGGNFGIQ